MPCRWIKTSKVLKKFLNQSSQIFNAAAHMHNLHHRQNHWKCWKLSNTGSFQHGTGQIFSRSLSILTMHKEKSVFNSLQTHISTCETK